MNEQEYLESAKRLYQLELDKRDIAAKQDVLKEHILGYMNSHKFDTANFQGYILEKAAYVRYSVPSPEKLREVLGKSAENYIQEIVIQDVRKDLPPQLAMELCPITKNTEYLRLKIGNGK